MPDPALSEYVATLPPEVRAVIEASPFADVLRCCIPERLTTSASSQIAIGPPEGEVWEVILISTSDIQNQSDHTLHVFLKARDAPLEDALKVALTHTGGLSVPVKVAAAVAANTATIWEPSQRWLLRPGDQMRASLSNATIGDTHRARFIYIARKVRSS